MKISERRVREIIRDEVDRVLEHSQLLNEFKISPSTLAKTAQIVRTIEAANVATAPKSFTLPGLATQIAIAFAAELALIYLYEQATSGGGGDDYIEDIEASARDLEAGAAGTTLPSEEGGGPVRGGQTGTVPAPGDWRDPGVEKKDVETSLVEIEDTITALANDPQLGFIDWFKEKFGFDTELEGGIFIASEEDLDHLHDESPCPGESFTVYLIPSSEIGFDWVWIERGTPTVNSPQELVKGLSGHQWPVTSISAAVIDSSTTPTDGGKIHLDKIHDGTAGPWLCNKVREMYGVPMSTTIYIFVRTVGRWHHSGGRGGDLIPIDGQTQWGTPNDILSIGDGNWNPLDKYRMIVCPCDDPTGDPLPDPDDPDMGEWDQWD